jgi:chromosome segregation ATPase
VEPTNVETGSRTDLELLESSLHGLWEKVKRAGEMIAGLREENRTLRVAVERMEAELRKAQGELQKKDLTVRDLQEAATARAGATSFADGDREELLHRAKDLLSRIESYL